MKSLALIACAALMGAGAVAVAADPAGPPPREKALMFYFTKSFGSTQRQNRAPLAFGLRLQQSASSDPRLNVALVDLRYSLDGKTRLNTFGVLALGEGEIGPQGSSSTSKFIHEHPVASVAIGLAAAAGLACAFEWGICTSKGPYREGNTVGGG